MRRFKFIFIYLLIACNSIHAQSAKIILPKGIGSRTSYTRICFSNDESMLLSNDLLSNPKLWNVSRGACLLEIKNGGVLPWSSFSPNDSMILFVSPTKLSVLDAISLDTVSSIEVDNQFNKNEFLDNSNVLIFGNKDLYTWNINSNKLETIIEGFDLQGCKYEVINNNLVAIAKDNRLLFIDLNNRKEVTRISWNSKVNRLIKSNSSLIVVDESNEISSVNLKNYKIKKIIQYDGQIEVMDYFKKQETLLIRLNNKVLQVLNLKRSKTTNSIKLTNQILASFYNSNNEIIVKDSLFVYLFNNKLNEEKSKIVCIGNRIVNSPKRNYFYCNNSIYSSLHLFRQSYFGSNSNIKAISYSQNGKKVATIVGNSVQVFNYNNLKTENFISLNFEPLFIEFHSNNKDLFIGSREGDMLMWNTETNEEIISKNCPYQFVLKAEFSADSEHIIVTGLNSKPSKWDYKNDIYNELSVNDIQYPNNINEQRNISVVSNNLYSYDEKKLICSSELEGTGWVSKLNKTGSIAMSVNPYYHQVVTWTTKDCQVKNIYEDHSTKVNSYEFTNNGQWIYSSSDDGEIILRDVEQSEPIARTFIIDNDSNKVLISIDSNYYYATPEALKLLRFEIGSKQYPLLQFDLKYNRPDLVLQKLQIDDKNLIYSFYKAYLKRLSKMKFTTSMLLSDFHLPVLKITNRQSIDRIIESKELQLKIEVSDTKYPLDRINIWVNNVPIYGINGISLRSKMTQDFDTTIQVLLNEGDNKIEVSVLNQAGAESYKETVYTTCTKKAPKPNLYFIGIGVKDYADANMNLKYSDKDIKDIAQMYAKNKSYDKVYIDTFLNSSVTTDILPIIEKRLATTTIHDQVIFMYSGHGLLDENLDYYLTTHDIDFSNPSVKGLPYDKVDELLDGIPARQKLVLIDACHSGEVDKDETTIASNKAGVQSTDFGKGDAFKRVEKTSNSFELMKELFTDLRRGTGATVISSSSGLYFSFEDAKYQNGIYTYALKLGLEGAADANEDNEITVTELKEFLYEKVKELTDGKQQPNTRQENLEYDYRVW